MAATERKTEQGESDAFFDAHQADIECLPACWNKMSRKQMTPIISPACHRAGVQGGSSDGLGFATVL